MSAAPPSSSQPVARADPDRFRDWVYHSKTEHLDILINNAGVMFPPASAITKHGHDLQVRLLPRPAMSYISD